MLGLKRVPVFPHCGRAMPCDPRPLLRANFLLVNWCTVRMVFLIALRDVMIYLNKLLQSDRHGIIKSQTGTGVGASY